MSEHNPLRSFSRYQQHKSLTSRKNTIRLRGRFHSMSCASKASKVAMKLILLHDEVALILRVWPELLTKYHRKPKWWHMLDQFCKTLPISTEGGHLVSLHRQLAIYCLSLQTAGSRHTHTRNISNTRLTTHRLCHPYGICVSGTFSDLQRHKLLFCNYHLDFRSL